METSSLTAAAKELFAAVTEPGAGESTGLDGWLDLLSESQMVLNTLAGVQAVAMAQVAAHDSDDDLGFGPRRHRGLGHQALDAADLVAARVGCSSQQAATRVGVAVAQVTTMPVLVAAMGAGRVEGFTAAVVADELSDAPADVRAEVTVALEGSGRLGVETPGPVRRSTRRLLVQAAPQVIADRAASERVRRGLHRSTASLGVDQWAAWLPVETSRPAWAAVTTLAQDYLRAGQADTLAQARADALTDLILGRATTTVVLHPTVPLHTLTPTEPTADFGGATNAADSYASVGTDPAAAGAVPDDGTVPSAVGIGDGDDLVPVSGYGTPGSTMIRRSHLRDLAGLTGLTRRSRRARAAEESPGDAARPTSRVRVGECLALDPDTGAVVGVLDTAHADPANADSADVLSARSEATTVGVAAPSTATGAEVVAVEAARVARGAAQGDQVAVRVPSTGGYRPSAEVERLVKARDGWCRFPGCQVPLRFVDLDHVRAYGHDDPTAGGPTDPANLACLCRRHHRIKQRRGWSVELHADGSMTWTDPSGIMRTTWPEDHRAPTHPPPAQRTGDRPDRRPHPGAAAPDPAPAPTGGSLAESTSASTSVVSPELASAPSDGAWPDPYLTPDLGSWDAERRADELEPYSVLEDQFLDLLTDSGMEPTSRWSAHRTLPRPPRRPPGRCPGLETDGGDRVLTEGTHAGRGSSIHPDRSHGQTLDRSIVLHPDTLAELDEATRRRSAPPF